MSTPHQGPVRRLANRVSRWRNTRRGTSTLKAAYSAAARDAKRMDPAVRERIGRAKMTKADLQQLTQASVAGAFRPGDRGLAQQLSDRAGARAQAAAPSNRRTLNPVRAVGNRVSRWRNTRQGTATLKAAYAQAARDVKRMDPAVRESIGRSKISKSDLQHLAQSQMNRTMRPEGRQTPNQQPPVRPQQQVRPQQAQAQPQQGWPQLQAQIRAQVQQQVRAQLQTPQMQAHIQVQVQTQLQAQIRAQVQAQLQAQSQAQAAPNQAAPNQAAPSQAAPNQAAPEQGTDGQASSGAAQGTPEKKAALAKNFDAALGATAPPTGRAASQGEQSQQAEQSGGGRHRRSEIGLATDGTTSPTGATKSVPDTQSGPQNGKAQTANPNKHRKSQTQSEL